MMTPRDLVLRHRLVICLGAGGVGKTTIAASLALGAARLGRRTLVVTIDPARRLASALGLDELDDLADAPRAVAPDLHATMLDRRRAWDRLIRRHAPSPEARDRVLGNRLYRDLSATFAGAHEYLALEEIDAASRSGRYDLIVVDTPPARHAFELLTAPSRLRGVIDRRFSRWLALARPLWSPLEGAHGPMADLGDFLAAMSDLFDAFAARAGAARTLLAGARTALVVVAGPDERGADDAVMNLSRLRDLDLPPAMVIVNRTHRALPEGQPDAADVAAVAATLGASGAWLVENYLAHARLAAGERRRVALLRAHAPVATVPRLDGDLADLSSLGLLATMLGLSRGDADRDGRASEDALR